MTDTNDSGTADKKAESPDITRREALAKLAKYSAYTAPTVMTLLASRPSMAQLSSVNQCTGRDDATGDPDPPPVSGVAFDGVSTGDQKEDFFLSGNRPAEGDGNAPTGDGADKGDKNADPTITTNDTVIDCGRA